MFNFFSFKKKPALEFYWERENELSAMRVKMYEEAEVFRLRIVNLESEIDNLHEKHEDEIIKMQKEIDRLAALIDIAPKIESVVNTLEDIQEDISDLVMGKNLLKARLEAEESKQKKVALELAAGLQPQNVKDLIEQADKIYDWMK